MAAEADGVRVERTGEGCGTCSSGVWIGGFESYTVSSAHGFPHAHTGWDSATTCSRLSGQVAFPLQAKIVIRELLPNGLRESISKVRSSVAYAVSAIAHWDWPEAWPQLFNLLMGMLVSGDVNAVHGAMRVLTGGCQSLFPGSGLGSQVLGGTQEAVGWHDSGQRDWRCELSLSTVAPPSCCAVSIAAPPRHTLPWS